MTELVAPEAGRASRRCGRPPTEAYPVIRMRDRHLMFVYVRGVGKVLA